MSPPKNRRCRNRAPHEAHVWNGLNTRGDGYQCAGVIDPYQVNAETGERRTEPFNPCDVASYGGDPSL